MDFRINVIRQILEAHVAPREEAAAVTRPLGGAQQPLRLSGRHFPRPLPYTLGRMTVIAVSTPQQVKDIEIKSQNSFNTKLFMDPTTPSHKELFGIL
ncbi:hypothetical protein J6590_074771 [Homalodisca vitripennis]|nr:hypothetical protein J6590_074771 [Homalodisca vitripennis]